MHNIRFVDCTGISTLMSAVKRVSSNTGTVNLVGCKSQLVRILCITAMYAFIALHQSIDDAIEAISGLASHCSALDEMPVVAECHSLETIDTTYI
jgi:anti-anti-sigma regulatory factor